MLGECRAVSDSPVVTSTCVESVAIHRDDACITAVDVRDEMSVAEVRRIPAVIFLISDMPVKELTELLQTAKRFTSRV